MQEVGIGFMMSPKYHPAMKIVAPVRRVLRVKTVFNILGPMLNPARVPFAVVGVYKEDMVYIVFILSALDFVFLTYNLGLAIPWCNLVGIGCQS